MLLFLDMVSQLNIDIHTYKGIFIIEFFPPPRKLVMTMIVNEKEVTSSDDLRNPAVLLIGDTGEYKQKREGIFYEGD